MVFFIISDQSLYEFTLLPPRRLSSIFLIASPMFKNHWREERTAAPLAAPSLRLIDEESLARQARKDLFEELLDEGDRRRPSPDSAVAVAKQREWERRAEWECERAGGE
jgi:hypothetical protein